MISASSLEEAREAIDSFMATFLDVSGLQHFSSIFVFLFVWIVVYAVLSWTHVLGQNNFVNVMVGLLLGIFVLISPLATSVISGIAPFLAVVFVFIILISMASKMLGANAESFPALKGISVVFLVVIVIIGVGIKIKSQATGSSDTTDLSKPVNLLFNSKFLGTVLIFSIAIFTVALLASKGGGGHIAGH